MKTWHMWAGFLAGCLLVLLGFLYRTNTDHTLQGSFGNVSLRIEVADTPSARDQGLGGRKNIPEDYGMLFVFSKPDLYGFWMKDMQVPIDIFWLDSDGRVVSKMEEVAPNSYPNVFYPTSLSQYVLETEAGFGVAHGIATGTPLRLQKFPFVSQ